MLEPTTALIGRVRARLRLRAIAHAVTIGGAILTVMLVVGASMTVAVTISVIAVAAMMARHWHIGAIEVARTIEARHSLDNLLVTAAEIEHQPRPVRSEIRDAILQQAGERARTVDSAAAVPLMQPIAVAAAVLIGCGLVARIGEVSQSIGSPSGGVAESNENNGITVRITPPAYTRKPVETHANPTQVTVVAGSVVRIETDTRVVREWRPLASESLDLRIQDGGGTRFLSVIVVPDAAPSVRITEPGRDTAFATAAGALRIAAESRDDLGLTALAIRYTKASGGGENVTFVEGEVPLTLERVNEHHWRARAQWSLDALALADGDVLVYRAVTRDGNPAGSAVESDAFLIEIGRTAEIASAGFALPSEERKYAISQQMVIYKTEQLIARHRQGRTQDSANAESQLEESRLIGMEQRMVRAEVVFLSGGDVQDEVEEAAHSHELAEGRLENRGRAEMLRAINFMSRAEAQLNAGNTADALLIERQALASLERALDRRRYFLRTLPDRSRIDTTRRLTGDRREARRWVRGRANTTAVDTDRLHAAMRELLAASTDPSRVNASLAARVAEVDPNVPALQQAAVAIANGGSTDQRRVAVEGAMQALTSHALAKMPASAAVIIPRDPLTGLLGAAIARRPR